jgi:glutathione S-transferase
MYRLHCFCQSGNCFKVAMMLNSVGASWTPVFVDYMNGATRDPNWRRTFNELGEIPVLEDGDLLLTQSGVILHYLADKHGQFGGNDGQEKREILRWILFDNHKLTGSLASYRFLRSFSSVKPDPAVMDWLRNRIETNFGMVERHLDNRSFVVADRPTIADFSMSGYLFYPSAESSFDLSKTHPNIAAWLSRIRALPGWADPYDILPGERIPPLSHP